MTSHTIHANNYACVVLLLAVFCHVVNQFTDLYLVVAFFENEFSIFGKKTTIIVVFFVILKFTLI
jgi:membrane-bound metal-dependent hydrolase YbcI (DUF457 family)